MCVAGPRRQARSSAATALAGSVIGRTVLDTPCSWRRRRNSLATRFDPRIKALPDQVGRLRERFRGGLAAIRSTKRDVMPAGLNGGASSRWLNSERSIERRRIAAAETDTSLVRVQYNAQSWRSIVFLAEQRGGIGRRGMTPICAPVRML